MFGLGFWELFVVVVVILVFVKPKDLPRFVYKVGKFYGGIMNSYHEMMHLLRTYQDGIKREVEKGTNLVDENEGMEAADKAPNVSEKSDIAGPSHAAPVRIKPIVKKTAPVKKKAVKKAKKKTLSKKTIKKAVKKTGKKTVKKKPAKRLGKTKQ